PQGRYRHRRRQPRGSRVEGRQGRVPGGEGRNRPRAGGLGLVRRKAAPGQRQHDPGHHHPGEARDGKGDLPQGRDDQHDDGTGDQARRPGHRQRPQVARRSNRRRQQIPGHRQRVECDSLISRRDRAGPGASDRSGAGISARKGGEIMQRNEKQELVGALRAKMVKAEIAIAVGYKNIDAAATVKLRKTFRDNKVDYKVVKNTLARLAAKGTPLEKFTEGLRGPNAIILGYDDVVAPAKVLRDVLKEQGEKMTVKAGVVQGNLVDAKVLAALANMPGLPELRGMLAAMIAGPATKLVRLLNTPGGQIARVLKAKSEKAA